MEAHDLENEARWDEEAKREESHRQTAAELKLVSAQLLVWKSKAEAAINELRGADEYQAGLRREIQRQMTLRESAEAALASTQTGLQSTIDHWMDRALKAESKTSLEGYRAMGEQVAAALDERDTARAEYKAARDIIWDMVRNLDAADYDRARKFLGMDEFSESGKKLAAEITQAEASNAALSGAKENL